MDFDLATLTTWVLPVLLAITLHEAAHAFAADALGDDTARQQGRLSLNPIRHVDPFGTILLPSLLLLMGTGVLFGWAKPVPVQFWRLRNPRRDMILVAGAGPAANIFLAFAAALLAYLVPMVPDAAEEWFQRNLVNLFALNLFIAVFNLLPIPPLDGGRILVGLLPAQLALPVARLEPYGMMTVIGLFLVLPTLGNLLDTNLSVSRWLIYEPAMALGRAILTVTGLLG